MFTGFASENTPAIQVWDFFRAFSGSSAIRSISLADDCAPIQIFRTGATAGGFQNIELFLPTSPIEGKRITIINQMYGSGDQPLRIKSSDVSGSGPSGSGTTSSLFILGQGGFLDIIYTKQAINSGTSPGIAESGWISLNQSSPAAKNAFSVSLGGNQNNCLSTYASVIGGVGNTSSGSNSGIFAGNSSAASNTNAAVVGGQSNAASGISSGVFAGQNNTTSASSSAVVAGTYGTERAINGAIVFPASVNPIASSVGVQQSATLILARQTTDATATRLTSNTSAAATTNQVTLPNNSAYTFQGAVIANVTGAGNTSSWKFEGAIKRGANAASTVLVAAVTPTVIAQDAGASAWVVAVTADTTLGCLNVTVTGAASTTIRWVCKIETTEVTF